MAKKTAVLLLFAFMATGLYLIKKSLGDNHLQSQFVILNWHQSPTKINLTEPTEFIIQLKDKQNLPLTNATLSIEANMNHAGMIPINTTANNFPNGVYKFKILFSMRGDWILFLSIKKEDGTMIKKELFVRAE